jgi:hypothetical protein
LPTHPPRRCAEFKFAFARRQIRYLAVTPRSEKVIKEIEFVKD